MKTLPKLFIIDSKNKQREWSVITEGDKIIVSYGITGGKIVTQTTTAKSKNIGRSNETTPEEQAVLEAKSKWIKQVEREDYHEDVNQAGKQVRPTLALDYLKVPHRVNWDDVVAQPKLDGLRLKAGVRYTDLRSKNFEMMTRKGESYNLPHLNDASQNLLDIVNTLSPSICFALDGELYKHGTPLQTITSLARKYQKGKTEVLSYYLFDLVIPGVSFIGRYKVLEAAIEEYIREYGDDGLFVLVPLQEVTKDTLEELQGEYMEQGFEGVILRHKCGEYAIGNRSPDLFKYKKFYTDEFKCVGIHLDKNGNAMLEMVAHAGKKLSCRDHILTEGIKFECTPKLPHNVRAKMLDEKEKWLGWWTVKYQDLTLKEIPTFNVGLSKRKCDSEGNPLI